MLPIQIVSRLICLHSYAITRKKLQITNKRIFIIIIWFSIIYLHKGELDHAINLSRPRLVFASKSVVKLGVEVAKKNAFLQNIILIDTEIDKSTKKFTNKLVTSYTGLMNTVKVS